LTIIISTKRSYSRKEAVPAIVQAIAVQERNTIVKALDLYYKERNKLDSFLISIDIYILFNTHLFGTETAKIIYAISYFQGITFNWVKTYINDFMAHKTSEKKITTIARTTTKEMFTNYKRFKKTYNRSWETSNSRI
jgi:hypothetical protein